MCADCPQPRLLPVNMPAVRAYAACRTQWRLAPSGMRTGLDYAGVAATLQLGTFRRPRRLFKAIRLIEGALLAAQHERWLADRAARGEGADGDR